MTGGGVGQRRTGRRSEVRGSASRTCDQTTTDPWLDLLNQNCANQGSVGVSTAAGLVSL